MVRAEEQSLILIEFNEDTRIVGYTSTLICGKSGWFKGPPLKSLKIGPPVSSLIDNENEENREPRVTYRSSVGPN